MAFGKKKAKTSQTAMNENLRKLTVRQAVSVAVVLVLVALPPIYVNHPIGYLPLVTFVFVLLMSWGYLQVVKGKFDAVPLVEESNCTRSTATNMSISLRNRSPLPLFRAQPCFYVTNPYGQLEQEVSSIHFIDANDTSDVGAEVVLGHIGKYTAGISNVIIFDPLALFHVNVECGGASDIVSTPQSFEIESVELERAILHSSAAPIRTVLSDDVDYAGVRDYEYGDPMKSVHWKLSARGEDLYTRLFETNVSSSTCVCIDFSAPDYDVENLMCCNDAVVEIALACCRLAKSKNMDLHLVYGNKSGSKTVSDVPRIDEADEFVEDLPLMSPNISPKVASDIVAEECNSGRGADNLIVCTSKLERVMTTWLMSAAASGVNVSVILAIPRNMVREFYRENRGFVQELEGASISCVIISDASDLEVSRNED